MAKCIKYYEWCNCQLAKSIKGDWFYRRKRFNPDYGWGWTSWSKIKITNISTSRTKYENMNGNELYDFCLKIFTDDFNYMLLKNGEINAYRYSNFRLPE